MATGRRNAFRVAWAPGFRRVNAGFLGYSIGEHATWLAVAFFALQRGGPSEVGLAAAAQLLPGVVLTPFSSYAGDRFRPQRALAVGYGVQSVAMAATALAMAADRGILAYAAGAVVATSISFTRPVMGTLLPNLTHAPADLVAANVVCGVIEQVGLVVGPLAAGVLLAVTSPAGVFAAAALLTGLACAATVGVRTDHDEVRAPPSGRDAVARLLAGFVTLRRSPTLRLLMVFVAGAGLVRGVGDVVFVTFADERLGAGGFATGYLAVVYGAGGLVGAALSTRLAPRRRTSSQFLVASAAGSAALLALSVAASYTSAGLAFALLGLGDALLVLTAVVTVQRIAPAEVLARLFGIVEGAQMGFIALGSVLVSVLTDTFTLGRALAVTGALTAAMLLAAAALLRRRGDEIPPVDDEVVDRLLADPVFASLPAPLIERLARGVERVHSPAGTRIVVEGEVGDRYYLVVSGTVEVSIAGAHVRDLGSGRSFGEIALLRDVPRTATATAIDDVSLVTVGRDEFLSAVTGHPRSFTTAAGVADRWLAVDGSR